MKSLPFNGPLRVAAYCRVSTDKEDQLNSLSAQRQFFQKYITEHSGWSLVRVFADEGLSGTSIKRRPQFAEMISHALDGEIDLIITKEVSRFARNTVDTLQVTRTLKEKGVGVLFLNDNIDTRENDGEFRLTIMASVAQEESRKISERTRWGQLQAMKRGVVFGNTIYGYKLAHGKLEVDPEQAEVIRLIYHKFLAERKGTHTISRELTQAGIRPPLRPSGAWSSTMVLNILKNEKHCGDLLQKKYRTTDYLSHRKILNDGTEEQVLLRNHHEPIISREQYEAAQAELVRRSGAIEDKSRFSARYWFSGRVRCGECGRSFTVKRTKRNNGTEYERFVCRGHFDPTVNCQMRAVHGAVLRVCAQRVLQEFTMDGQAIIDGLLLELKELRRTQQESRDEIQPLQAALQKQLDRRDRAMEAFLDGDLSKEDMQRLVSRCDEEASRLRERMEEGEKKRKNLAHSEDRYGEIRALLEQELAGGDEILEEVIRRITVYPDYFLVEVEGIPMKFRVRIETSGTGRQYRVHVTECKMIPDHAV